MTQHVSQGPAEPPAQRQGRDGLPAHLQGRLLLRRRGRELRPARRGRATAPGPIRRSTPSAAAASASSSALPDSQLLMLIMTEKGLNAVLDSQIKLGANAGIAVATLGAGIGGSTTTAVGADIVGLRRVARPVRRRGAGRQRDVDVDTTGTKRYYGQPFAARQTRHADAGQQSRRRSAARPADPVRHKDRGAHRRARRRAAASARLCAGLSGLPAIRQAPVTQPAPALGRQPHQALLHPQYRLDRLVRRRRCRSERCLAGHPRKPAGSAPRPCGHVPSQAHAGKP